MTRFAFCGALLALLAACGARPVSLSTGSVPVGVDASTGAPNVSSMAYGPGGINRDYNIGGDPNFPQSGSSGRR